MKYNLFIFLYIFLILIIFGCGAADVADAGWTLTKITEDSEPPVIENITVSKEYLDKEDTIQINVTAVDPEGKDLYYYWASPSGSFLVKRDTESYEIWQSPILPNIYTIHIRVADRGGVYTDTSIVVPVRSTGFPPVEFVSPADDAHINNSESVVLQINVGYPNTLLKYFTLNYYIGDTHIINSTGPDFTDEFIFDDFIGEQTISMVAESALFFDTAIITKKVFINEIHTF